MTSNFRQNLLSGDFPNKRERSQHTYMDIYTQATHPSCLLTFYSSQPPFPTPLASSVTLPSLTLCSPQPPSPYASRALFSPTPLSSSVMLSSFNLLLSLSHPSLLFHHTSPLLLAVLRVPFTHRPHPVSNPRLDSISHG